MFSTEAGTKAKGRFLIKKEEVRGDILHLSGAEARHASESLRLKAGDRIWATDGDGGEFLATIEKVQRKSIECRVLERKQCRDDARGFLWLAQPVLRPGRMDIVIEKCTELGVRGFLPYLSPRSSVGVRGKPGEEKLARWRRISESAVKQCLASFLPEFSGVKNFDEIAASAGSFEKVYLADETSGSRLKYLPDTRREGRAARVLLITGPEGGFSKDERNVLIESGAIPFSLGTRRLRSETASIVAAGLLLYSFG